MMTEPTSPAPYLHPQPLTAAYPHHNGYKRPFQQYEEHDLSDRERAKPEPKRRARKKTQSPSERVPDLWSVDPILENMKVLMEQRMEEVRNGKESQIEL